MNCVLGLDISTSVVGMAIVDKDTKKLMSLSYVNLKKEKGLFNKAIAMKTELEKYKGIVNEVAIEEPLVMFKEGFSRAQVLSLLSRFNGMIAILSYFIYNVEPIMYNVQTARKLAFSNIKYPKGKKRKEIVFEYVCEAYPDIKWEYKPRAKTLKDECYDMADAAVIALAHCNNSY